MPQTGLLKTLGSVKLTVALLILLILASILGTLIPQDWSEAQYKNKYGETYTLLKNLQFTKVYHSYWYTALLTIFCINLIICSTTGFVPLVKSLQRSSIVAERVDISSLPFYKKLPLKSGNDKETIQKIKSIFSSSLYRLKFSDENRGIHYFERGKMGRLGPVITHGSIIVILIGGIIVGRLGFNDYRNVTVGKTVDVPHADFQIRADDFAVELYPNGSPKDYKSVLTVVEDGKDIFTKTIEVNDPLRYKGINFFQSSYGMSDSIEIELSKKSEDQADAVVLGKFRLGTGEEIQVPDTQIKIKALSIVPDFIRDDSGRVGSRSMEPRNPAALLELYEGEELKTSSWVFQKFPEFHASGDSDYSLKFLSTVYFTGLQISHAPGIYIVWIGCLLMVVGMFLAFYWPYKRIWVNLSANAVEMGGRAYKDRAGFEKEFEKLRNALQGSAN